MSRIYNMTVASVYKLYVAKVERKGHTQAEVDQVILWLTGFSKTELNKHLKAETTFEDFFADAKMHPKSELITGSICGVKIQEIEEPLMKQIRMLDKLVDEVAKGRPMAKILRK